MYDRYRVYILRYWSEPSPNLPHLSWRFVIEDIQGKQRRGFADLTSLVFALKQEIEAIETGGIK